ncbi:toxin-antitoxin system toxin subunit [Opitutaceae bacterium TAV4]|nr:toxin-antitoxin system toxin subunit [Opitutaceae bacterium TAV4]RRJ98862.1 toxin-antitoxin system toxin subunit [Opitutaceae bacterium TAV3]
MNALATLFCSQVRAGLLRLLFGLEAGELHLRELQRRTGLAVRTIEQDVRKLLELGLVSARRSGNRLYYQANRQHPLYPELHGIVLKTAGLADVLLEALGNEKKIRIAFVFGSLARHEETSGSDVDLMIIGDIGQRALASRLRGAADTLHREINPHIFSVAELQRRHESNEHFWCNVLANPKLFVIGNAHELEHLATKRLAEASPDDA